MDEMIKRGYRPNLIWRNENWRGNTLKEQSNWCNHNSILAFYDAATIDSSCIFPEHNEEYLQECLDNLTAKGININL